MGTVSPESVPVICRSRSAKRTGDPRRHAVIGHGPEDDSRRQFRARPDELVRCRRSRNSWKGKRRSESALAILDDGHAADASCRTIIAGQSCRGVRSRLLLSIPAVEMLWKSRLVVMNLVLGSVGYLCWVYTTLVSCIKVSMKAGQLSRSSPLFLRPRQ
jgi:hypothetical protein